ncbi:MAG TPA: hypothetical protein VLH81_08610, partial [Desulfobacterales bacterium]|nr:hypothetical protein [Desulfobacterales bacterium]
VVHDCLVTAARSMRMLVRDVLDVHVCRLKERLVGVVAVRTMDVTVVQVVRMVTVGNRGVAACGPVGMGMGLVGNVGGHRCHRDSPSWACLSASRAMWATWSSTSE